MRPEVAMEIGVRKITVEEGAEDLLVFYAIDVDGHSVPVDVGRDGLDRILGILSARRRSSIERRERALAAALSDVADAVSAAEPLNCVLSANREEVLESLQPGQAFVERLDGTGRSEFRLFGEDGDTPLQDWSTDLDEVVTTAAAFGPK